MDAGYSVHYDAAPGEANIVTSNEGEFSTTTYVTDTGPGVTVTAGAGCQPVVGSANTVSCTSLDTTGNYVYLNGGDGSDQLAAIGSGSAHIDGGPGNDLIVGGNRDDVLTGGPGADRIVGGDGGDRIHAGDCGDFITAGDGPDIIWLSGGGAGVYGEGGNDDFVVSPQDCAQPNDVHGGDGAGDRIDVPDPGTSGWPIDKLASISLDDDANDGTDGGTLSNFHSDIEDVVAGPEPDLIVGSDAANALYGGAGEDAISGGAGDDTISGESGFDFLDGGTGADTIDGGDDEDVVDYSARTTAVTINLDSTTPSGAPGEGDTIRNVEDAWGGDGNDTLTGSGEYNVLDGGPGADTFVGGDGEVAADYSARTSPVNVSEDGVANDGEPGEGDNVMPSVSDIWGGDGNDVLKGGDGPNLLDGGPGADVMNGGGDIDIVDYSYRVAPVTANLDGSAGDDGQAGEGDTIGADVEGLFGGSGNDTLTGNAADGVIFGGDGADTIRDAGGRDFIDSGDGSDAIFAFDGASDTISCEGGPDVVSADPIDDVGSDCGYVSRQPPAPPTPPTAVETTLASIPTMLAADSVLFNFTASQAGSTFVCTLDGKSSGCTSPFQASGLSQGTHHFTVQAIGANGTRDATPPTSTFTVDTVKPTIAIKQPKARCVGRAGEKLRISGGDANAVGHVTVKLGTKVLANTSARSATARVTRPLLRKHGRRLRISIADTAGNTARKSVYLRRC